jgi:hypothetical protein
MKFKGYILLGLIMICTLTGCGSGFEWFPGTPQALTIFTTTLPNAAIGTPYSQTLLATGGKTPYVWTLDSGTLPDGLKLNFYGVISGTPTIASTTQTFTVKLTDSASPNVTATKSLTITIPGTGGGLTITTTSPLKNAPRLQNYTTVITASGGSGTYTFQNLSTASGRQLPYGLILNPSGLLSGSPTSPAAIYNFTVQVTDTTSPTPGSVSKIFSLTVGP